MDTGATSPNADHARDAVLRSLPSVDRLARAAGDRLDGLAGDARLTRAARDAIHEARAAILSGSGESRIADLEALIDRVAERLRADEAPALAGVINATGVLLHTGLGRAPLGPALARAADALAGRYAPVELDLDSGRRGRRARVVEELLCSITGAEAATAVNNNAGAMVLTLGALAGGREVVVSRGELVEIGGSFRLPEIIETGGARLREVGTTNRTRPEDYERAIGERTAALMKVHPSNYRVEGFAGQTPIEDLARIGRARALPVIHDIGSGLLTDRLRDAFGIDEPTAEAALRAGADLVLFSADKLLGGPQAGVIVGRRDLVERVERHALMRALRLDKLTLAVLAETLKTLRDPGRWEQALPVLALVRQPLDDLRTAAEEITADLRRLPALAEVGVVESEAFVGGGSAPGQGIPGIAIRLRGAGLSEAELARRLRHTDPPIVGRIQDGAVLLELRSVHPTERDALAPGVRAALAGS